MDVSAATLASLSYKAEPWGEDRTGQQCTHDINTEVRTCNHCFSGKAIGAIYSNGLFVALSIHHAMRVCQTVNCGLSGSKIFF